MTDAADPRPSQRRTAFAILGFLANSPRSGYDLRHAIARSTGYFWTESYGQIYPALRGMESDGLIERMATAGTGRRPRQTYCITALGLEALRRWLEQPVEELTVRNELLLKLFFGREVPLQTSLGHIEAYRERLLRQKELYEGYREVWRQPSHADVGLASLFRIAPLEHGIQSAVARIRWCDETMEAIREAMRRTVES